MGKKKGGAKAKAKKEARRLAQEKQQAKLDTLRRARELVDPLAQLPPPFATFKRNGIDAAVEFYTRSTLSASDRKHLHAILDENMAPIYGQQDWEEEASADKQKELAEEEARILIIRGNAVAAADSASSPTSSPVKEPGESAPKNDQTPVSSGILGFMHFRYEIEEECLLLYIYELQIANKPEARRKGLGKFFLMLAEMLAKKSGFGGVMLTVQKTNEAAMKFYAGCKYTPDKISPCNVDPMADDEDYSY